MPISWISPVTTGPVQASRGHVVPASPGAEWLLGCLLGFIQQRQRGAPRASPVRISAATVGKINSGGTSGNMIVVQDI